MDDSYLKTVVRALAKSRRSLLGGSLALAIGWLEGSTLDARKKRKRRKRKPKAKPNAYGCLNVGQPCKNADQCCSGICEGKKGKRTCRAHGEGTCAPDAPGVCHDATPEITICNNDECWCARTTGNSVFCANAVGTVSCEECQRDADCVALGFPVGSACVPWSGGLCGGPCAGKAVCLLPCGVDPPGTSIGTA